MRPEDNIEFKLPWVRLTAEERMRFDAELVAEVCLLHNLATVDCSAVARRVDCDDVLFALNHLCECAVVHLTWSGGVEMDPRYPAYKLYATFDDWIQERMVPDHNGYSADDSA